MLVSLRKKAFVLNAALERSLKHWRKLIESGPPRPIEFKSEKVSDAVIFTDGFTPDPRFDDVRPSRIGAVLFDRKAIAPVQFSEVVPKWVQQKWLPRKTQIVPVEMLAPIIALETFRDRLYGADIILLIDSEAVEAALVKGYSSKEDLLRFDLGLLGPSFSAESSCFYRQGCYRCESCGLAIERRSVHRRGCRLELC